MHHILSHQTELRSSLPTIEGNVDYAEYRRQLRRIHELLVHGGVETDFVNASPRQQLLFQQHSVRALRCNIARTLLQESFRAMSARIADSPPL